MTSTEKLTINQVEEETGVDLSCKACRGTGLVPNYSDDWLPILLKLGELGKIRAQNRHPIGTDGHAALQQAWRDIVEIVETRADPAHIPRAIAAKAAGLEKGSFYYGLKAHGGRD